MTAAELIEALARHDPNAEVVLHDYGMTRSDFSTVSGIQPAEVVETPYGREAHYGEQTKWEVVEVLVLV